MKIERWQVEKFIETLGTKSVNTRDAYRRDLMQLVSYLEGNEDVTPIDYLAKIKGERATASVSRIMASINGFYSYGIVKEWFEDNPIKGEKAPRVVTMKKHEVIIETFPQGYSDVAVRDRAMIEVMLDTGYKASRITSLRISDVDTIVVSQQTARDLEDYIYGSRDSLLKGKECEALFVNCDGNTLSRQGFWKIMKKYGRV